MWLLPTHARPDNLRTVLAACVDTGMSTPGIIHVNAGPMQEAYRSLEIPANWQVVYGSEDMSLGDVMRWFHATYPALPWYGIITDDQVPVTAGWDTRLVEEAGRTRIVSSNDGWQAPQRIHGAVVFGGEVVKLMGYLAPPGFQHQFIDDVWEAVGRDSGLWSVLMDVMVEHRHPMKEGSGAHWDASYQINFSRQQEDQRRFKAWETFERHRTITRLAPLLNQNTTRMVDLSKVKVTIATPCYGGQLTEQYVQSMMATIPVLLEYGIGYEFLTLANQSLVHRARNQIVRRFMDSDTDYLCMIDADMGWKPDALLRLLASGKDVAAVAGPRKQDPVSFCINLEGPPAVACPQTGFLEAQEVGSGFMVLSRKAIQMMADAHQDRRYFDPGSQQWVVNLFENTIEDYREYSEDYTFCRRWRKLGGKVYVDPNSGLDHVGSRTFHGKFGDWLVAQTQAALAEQRKQAAE